MSEVATTGKTLRWARERLFLTIEQAADELAITIAALDAIENERELPGVVLFRKMSRVYQLPQATLMRRTPPSTPALPKDFRTIGGMPALLGPDAIRAIYKVRDKQFQLSELIKEDVEVWKDAVPKSSTSVDAQALAEKERARLGVTDDEQLSWDDADDAFRKLRRKIELSGVFVYIEKFPTKEALGFSIYDKGAPPAICINWENEWPTSRLFSLLHEYAHIIIREPGVSDYVHPRTSVERFCNTFAATFLMPVSILMNNLPRWPERPSNWTVDEIRQSSKSLHVSQQALALRLEELKLAPKGFFDRFKSGQPEAKLVKRERKDNGGPSYYTLQKHALGTLFVATVFTAMGRGILSAMDAARILRVRPDLLNKMQ